MARWDKDHKPPSDWNEQQDGWHMVLLCLPNSVEWRTTLLSAMWEMTSARFYSWEDGAALEAKKIAVEVLASVSFDCNNDLARIAAALEAINAKTPSLVTLQEFMNGMADVSTIGLIAEWLSLGDALAAVLPNLDIVMPVGDWIKMFFSWRLNTNMLRGIDKVANAIRLLAMGQGGETVAEGLETIDGYLDDISDWVQIALQGGQAAAEGLQAWALLSGLFSSDGADENEALRNLNRLYNDIFVTGEAMSVNVNNTQTVNCGNGSPFGCGSGTSTGFIPDQTPCGTSLDEGTYQLPNNGPLSFPSDWSDYDTWRQYKCKASNAMAYNLAESIYKIYDIAHKEHPTETHSLVVQSVTLSLMSLDFMFGFDWLYSSAFYQSMIQWEAEAIADYIYQAPDLTPFQIFYDVRNALISDRQEFTCEIFNQTKGSDVKIAILQKISDYINALSYDPAIEAWCYQIIEDMLSEYWCNIPFKHYDMVDGFSDGGAIDCQYCSDYLYPTGTCSTTYSQDNNSAEGDGDYDGIPAGPYPYTSWMCEFDSPITIGPDTTLEVYWHFSGDGQINFYLYATVDGVEHYIDNWDFQSGGNSGWLGASVGAYSGQDLEGVRWQAVDRGLGPDPWHYVDGVRVGNWQ